VEEKCIETGWARGENVAALLWKYLAWAEGEKLVPNQENTEKAEDFV
jgi:hypothetical protein